jgi:hypothetical protein
MDVGACGQIASMETRFLALGSFLQAAANALVVGSENWIDGLHVAVSSRSHV